MIPPSERPENTPSDEEMIPNRKKEQIAQIRATVEAIPTDINQPLTVCREVLLRQLDAFLEEFPLMKSASERPEDLQQAREELIEEIATAIEQRQPTAEMYLAIDHLLLVQRQSLQQQGQENEPMRAPTTEPDSIADQHGDH
jgi:hypothetical protein